MVSQLLLAHKINMFYDKLLLVFPVPTMEFQDTLYYGTEPLSNFDIDRTVTTLTLTRHGDLSYTTAVRYVIRNGSASVQPPTDPSQEVVFHSQETSKELQIVLRANPEKSEVVFIDLVEGRMVDNVSVPVRVGSPNRSAITIHNHDYRGPFFPDLPVVANDGDSVIHTSLFYDLPLHCITVSDAVNECKIIQCLAFVLYMQPCSSLYLAERERLNSSRQGCAAQNISQESALFSWEISRDGVDFTALEHTTALISTHSEILDTFYLKAGLYVRCSAQAVSLAGVKGHTRTSRAVFLGGERYSCDGSGERAAELTSYSSFGGHNKVRDVVGKLCDELR